MEKKRLQFDFTEEAVRELDELQELTGLSTRADLIRHALRFLQWAVVETQDGDASLLLQKGGDLHRVVLPFITLKGRKNRPPSGDKSSDIKKEIVNASF